MVEIFGWCIKKPCMSTVVESGEFAKQRMDGRNGIGRFITGISSTKVCTQNGAMPGTMNEYIDCEVTSNQRDAWESFLTVSIYLVLALIFIGCIGCCFGLSKYIKRSATNRVQRREHELQQVAASSRHTGIEIGSASPRSFY